MKAPRLIRRFHDGLARAFLLERRIDPFFRPLFDALCQEPLAWLVQALVNLGRPDERLALAEERTLPNEEALIASIIEEMGAYMRETYGSGHFERGGNTKTHGVVRGRFVVRADIPASFRHGLFREPREYPAWVRFAGPGPASPPDIDDVGVLSIGVKLMEVEGPKLLDDERHTLDLSGISAPTFTTPNVIENAKLQRAIRAGTPLFYFIDPRDPHVLDAAMQGLWARTQTSPLETPYWSCVPYLLGAGQAMRYSFVPKLVTRSRVPRLPLRPPDNYLREAMQSTLSKGDAKFDFRIQVQTDPHRMPIENASVRWPEKLSPSVGVAELILPQQVFDRPAQLAFADRLSFNPWHTIAEHRPLGNQNRGRRRIYAELARLRQTMNRTPHVEPDGREKFD